MIAAICGKSLKHKKNRFGFSLVEIIGVLAIMAVIAAFTVPVVIKRYDIAARNKEYADLTAISNALTLQMIRTYSIPNETGWAQAAASWLNRPVNQITANNRGYQRYFIIDPNLSLPGFSLPYTQGNNNGLSSAPLNGRFMIVSTLARGNAPLTSGSTLVTSNFNTLWNLVAGQKPPTWTNYPGTSEDICIQKINLTPLFFQLILNNRDHSSAAQFSINSTTPNVVANTGLNNYYMDGTVLGLYSNTVLATSCVLKKNSSFVFENGAWFGQLVNGPPITTNVTAVFTSTANSFFSSPWNPNSPNGQRTTDQGAVLGSMINFMLAYTMWANDTPHFYRYGVTANNLSKLQVWVLLDREAAGSDPNNKGNLSDFSDWLLQ